MIVTQYIKNVFARSPRFVIATLIVILLMMGIGLYVFLKPHDKEKKDFRTVAVEVEEVRVGSLTRTITAVGTLVANQTVTIRPEVNGVVSKIHVDGGEFVEKDAPLFELDDRLFQAELKEAEARLAFARVEFNRAKQLAAHHFGSAQKLDDARAKLLIAEAAVESAKAKLERAVIRAPFQGIVGLHNLAIGTQVGPDKEIATLVDITPIKVDFKLPAEYLPYISVGQRVEIKVDGFGDKKFTGLIAGIDSKVDPAAHSINVRALMPNKNNIFKPGLFARVDVVVGSKDNTLIIPEVAIEMSGDQDTVYKVVEGLAFQVPVLLGIREGENVEVLRGLNPGDHIVVVGQSKLRDGMPVRYELNGQTYAFDEDAFRKKQQEFEEKKKQEEQQKQSEQPTEQMNSPRANTEPSASDSNNKDENTKESNNKDSKEEQDSAPATAISSSAGEGSEGSAARKDTKPTENTTLLTDEDKKSSADENQQSSTDKDKKPLTEGNTPDQSSAAVKSGDTSPPGNQKATSSGNGSP